MPFEWLASRRKTQEQGAYWYLDMQRKRNTGIGYNQQEWERFSKKYLKEALGVTFFGLKTKRQKAVEEYLKLKRHEIFMSGDQFKELRASNISSRLLSHPRWQGVKPEFMEFVKGLVVVGNEVQKLSRDVNGFRLELKSGSPKVFAYGTQGARELAKLFAYKTSRNEPEKAELTAKELGLEEDIEGYILKKYGMKTKIKKIPYAAYNRGLKDKLLQLSAYKPAIATT